MEGRTGRAGRRRADPSDSASQLNQNQFQQIYSMVKRIPAGKVSTYGAIARGLGWAHGARQVGWALRATEDPSVPWHRIINSRGQISLPGRTGDLQKALLEAEGIVFDSEGRLDLAKYQWNG